MALKQRAHSGPNTHAMLIQAGSRWERYRGNQPEECDALCPKTSAGVKEASA